MDVQNKSKVAHMGIVVVKDISHGERFSHLIMQYVCKLTIEIMKVKEAFSLPQYGHYANVWIFYMRGIVLKGKVDAGNAHVISECLDKIEISVGVGVVGGCRVTVWVNVGALSVDILGFNLLKEEAEEVAFSQLDHKHRHGFAGLEWILAEGRYVCS